MTLFLFSAALFYEHRGFDSGFVLGKSKCTLEETILTSIHGPRTYEFFSSRYFYLMLIGIVLIGVNRLERNLTANHAWAHYALRTVNLGLIFLAIHQCYEIFEIKWLRIGEDRPFDSFDSLWLSSLPFDRVILTTLFGLSIVEIIRLFRRRKMV